VRQFQECGLTMEKLQSIPEHHLQEMFCSGIEHSKQPSARQKELEALLPGYAARVKRKGVTVKSPYEEYIKSHPGGYQRSAFGRYLQRYTLSTRAAGHVEHYAGDQMYIGYAASLRQVPGKGAQVVYGTEEQLRHTLQASLQCAERIHRQAC